MKFTPDDKLVEQRAVELYTAWFDTRTVSFSNARYGLQEIIREKARAQLIREASSETADA